MKVRQKLIDACLNPVEALTQGAPKRVSSAVRKTRQVAQGLLCLPVTDKPARTSSQEVRPRSAARPFEKAPSRKTADAVPKHLEKKPLPDPLAGVSFSDLESALDRYAYLHPEQKGLVENKRKEVLHQERLRYAQAHGIEMSLEERITPPTLGASLSDKALAVMVGQLPWKAPEAHDDDIARAPLQTAMGVVPGAALLAPKAVLVDVKPRQRRAELPPQAGGKAMMHGAAEGPKKDSLVRRTLDSVFVSKHLEKERADFYDRIGDAGLHREDYPNRPKRGLPVVARTGQGEGVGESRASIEPVSTGLSLDDRLRPGDIDSDAASETSSEWSVPSLHDDGVVTALSPPPPLPLARAKPPALSLKTTELLADDTASAGASDRQGLPTGSTPLDSPDLALTFGSRKNTFQSTTATETTDQSSIFSVSPDRGQHESPPSSGDSSPDGVPEHLARALDFSINIAPDRFAADAGFAGAEKPAAEDPSRPASATKIRSLRPPPSQPAVGGRPLSAIVEED
jgi:hypothetical protein